MQQFIPGMRVEIRDAEWRVQRVDMASDGGYLLTCIGQSELVRGRTAQFLSNLEQNARILDPAHTELVDDLSDGYLAGQLFIDTALRQTPPADDKVHMGHKAAMDLLPFQLDPTLQALKQPRQRIMISDAVGLGKTLEAGILVSELIRRGRGKRILVLAVKSMLSQFQREFWQRFTIPLVRLDSVGLQRVRNDIPTNHNPFHYYDRTIISIDTLKHTLEYRHHLEQAYWDIIIIDEAHNVARRSTNSQRHKLAELLSTRSDTLIMLSATPHDGKAESFASLVNMLDPTAIANPKDYAHEDFRDKGLVVRRFKKDVAAQLSKHFPERNIDTVKIAASVAEEAVFSVLKEATFNSLDGRGKSGAQLFRTTLMKALFSSPAACLSTVDNRLKKLVKKADQPEVEEDMVALEGIASALRAVKAPAFSKYQLLLRMLSKEGADSLGWNPKDSEDRLVIFTESLETLDFLKDHIAKDLKLKKNQVAVLKGTMQDKELAKTVDDFNNRTSPVRLLLCSDVASEGINLHHLSHRMIHFDIPWSLMVFQQRNGRIDRYGQTKTPQIRYLMTTSDQPEVFGDQRIYEVLTEKDAQAGINIGDPSEFMGAFSPEEEEAKIGEAVEAAHGEDVTNSDDISDIFAGLFADGGDDIAESAETSLSAFTSTESVTGHSDLVAAQGDSITLFEQDFDFAKAALRCIRESNDQLQYVVNDDKRQIDFTAPSDLRQRLKYLPREVRPEDDRFFLTDDRDQIQEVIGAARDLDDALFSNLQYLWGQHPVMEWLMTRAQDFFGRHTAPVIRLPNQLEPGEHWFVIQGGFPNKRGQALIQSSQAVLVQNGKITADAALIDILRKFDLTGHRIPNRAVDGDTTALQSLLPAVIGHVTKRLKERRTEVQAEKNTELREHLDKLDSLRNKHLDQLELDLTQGSHQPQAFLDRRKRDRMEHIDRVFEEYKQWLEETRHTEEEPYIQVIAVLTGDEAVAVVEGEG
ncbi:DEAD/DEAH box helicase [Microbulbifer sp. JTAC008]|uniref:DEAD/DEAH box helicase n=1 Tax=unclassified Microbulbifer TaxID=2619833 RepID=UPI0040394525